MRLLFWLRTRQQTQSLNRIHKSIEWFNRINDHQLYYELTSRGWHKIYLEREDEGDILLALDSKNPKELEIELRAYMLGHMAGRGDVL